MSLIWLLTLALCYTAQTAQALSCCCQPICMVARITSNGAGCGPKPAPAPSCPPCPPAQCPAPPPCPAAPPPPPCPPPPP
ncbi:unnamed protein product, partial [Enterobius vermicularis]|uniref:IGFBP N-terminal domain-containing protein n=1 Tax=Enterobius vermicularis TaxID=51028 RepID=A0A0N4VHG0_ENTVE